jgi:glycosyltransferase involved in cell wall biosynthesis
VWILTTSGWRPVQASDSVLPLPHPAPRAPEPVGRWPGPETGWTAPEGDGRVTVVIPTRDRPHLIGRAIRSVLAQTRKSARVIVVKNGAGQFREYLDAFGAWTIDPRFLFLWRDDLAGFAGPINAGLERVETEYAAVLDDDDELDPRFLERLGGALDADRTLGLAYCDVAHPSEIGIRRTHGHPAAATTFSGTIRLRPWFGWSQVVFRVDLLRPDLIAPEAGGSADWDAWLKIAARAGAYHVPEPLAAHWWHGGNASLDTEAMKRGQDWIRAGIRDGRYGHQDTPGRDADGELVRSLTDLQRAAVESCGHRREVDRCCGPATYCDLGRIETSATATADCARCVTADLRR